MFFVPYPLILHKLHQNVTRFYKILCYVHKFFVKVFSILDMFKIWLIYIWLYSSMTCRSFSFLQHGTWVYVVPYGIKKTLLHMKERYSNPKIYITENGWLSNINICLILHYQFSIIILFIILNHIHWISFHGSI